MNTKQLAEQIALALHSEVHEGHITIPDMDERLPAAQNGSISAVADRMAKKIADQVERLRRAGKL